MKISHTGAVVPLLSDYQVLDWMTHMKTHYACVCLFMRTYSTVYSKCVSVLCVWHTCVSHPKHGVFLRREKERVGAGIQWQRLDLMVSWFDLIVLALLLQWSLSAFCTSRIPFSATAYHMTFI